MQAPENTKDVSIATEHNSSGIRRSACSKPAVRELPSEKLQI